MATSRLSNCIDCHMPNLESRSLTVQIPTGGAVVPIKVRTHKIAIYKEQSDAVLMRAGTPALR